MSRSIYAIYKFINTGSSTRTEAALVTTDTRSTTGAAGSDAEKLDALQPGQSSIVVIAGNGAFVREGYRVTRLPDYAASALMFDTQAKEFVKVTNGICVLDHSSTEGFAAAHNGGECVFAPHEAIALRPVFLEDGTIGLAYTYRGVDAAYLQPVTKPESIEKMFQLAVSPDRKQKKTFIGRV